MRWEQLFADLEARYEDLARAEDMQEISTRERLAQGEIHGSERLRGAVGLRIRVGTTVNQLAGELRQVGPDWFLLEESPGRELLLPMRSVMAVEGLVAQTGPPTVGVGARLDLRYALRGLARDRAAIGLQTIAGTEINGTIDRVGADFIEMARHAAWEARRSGAVRAVLMVPLAAIDHIRSVALG